MNGQHEVLQREGCRVVRWLVAGVIAIMEIGLGPSALAASSTTAVPPFANPVPAIIQLVLALVLVIGGILFVIRWLARRAGVQARGAIEVLAARQVAPNRSVQVIAVRDKRFLIGVGDQVSLLADVTEDFPDGASLDPTVLQNAQPFAQVLADKLAAVRKRYNNKGGAD